MNAEHWAREAQRLQDDNTFNRALDDIKRDALEKLAKADAEKPTDIIQLQQRVQVVDEIRNTLGMYVGATETSDAGPVV